MGRDPGWNGWEDLGGPISSAPAVASTGPNHLAVFAAGLDGKLMWRTWTGGPKWNPWNPVESLQGVKLSTGPAAVSWGPGRIDVLVRDTNGKLWHTHGDGSTFSPTPPLTLGPISSAPGVTSRGNGQLEVLAAGPDGHVMTKQFNQGLEIWDSHWKSHSMTGPKNFKGGPAAMATSMSLGNIFVRESDDTLSSYVQTNFEFNPGSAPLGKPFSSAPGVARSLPNRLDVFAAGPGGNLLYGTWGANFGPLGTWEWVGGVFHDNPAAVSWGPNRIDVFVRGMDNHLGHIWRG
jgi:hypothetical protein